MKLTIQSKDGLSSRTIEASDQLPQRIRAAFVHPDGEIKFMRRPSRPFKLQALLIDKSIKKRIASLLAKVMAMRDQILAGTFGHRSINQIMKEKAQVRKEQLNHKPKK